MHIAILGAGLVGNAIVKDLAQDETFKIKVVDLNQQALKKLESELPVKGVKADLLKGDSVASVTADSDLVICAVPGFMGFETLKRIIEAGKNVVDISFFGEDTFLLDDLAKKRGVTAVVDCGVAPGLCNIIAGYRADRLDQADRYVCYVGGLPKERVWPYEYKAVFSPSDVLEEYTRPARMVENGEVVVYSALSDVELIEFPRVGELEAFNTDGLRTLQKTMKFTSMKEKTLRYPGHANLMRIFRESGFLSTDVININGKKIKPIDLTSELLFKQWKLQDGEEDFTVMRVIIEGKKENKKVCYTYDLYDEYDKETKTTSMARTTGYTCTIIARQIINGMFSEKGTCPPEFLGRTRGCFENLLNEYASRKIKLTETIT